MEWLLHKFIIVNYFIFGYFLNNASIHFFYRQRQTTLLNRIKHHTTHSTSKNKSSMACPKLTDLLKASPKMSRVAITCGTGSIPSRVSQKPYLGRKGIRGQSSLLGFQIALLGKTSNFPRLYQLGLSWLLKHIPRPLLFLPFFCPSRPFNGEDTIFQVIIISQSKALLIFRSWSQQDGAS